MSGAASPRMGKMSGGPRSLPRPGLWATLASELLEMEIDERLGSGQVLDESTLDLREPAAVQVDASLKGLKHSENGFPVVENGSHFLGRSCLDRLGARRQCFEKKLEIFRLRRRDHLPGSFLERHPSVTAF